MKGRPSFILATAALLAGSFPLTRQSQAKIRACGSDGEAEFLKRQLSMLPPSSNRPRLTGNRAARARQYNAFVAMGTL